MSDMFRVTTMRSPSSPKGARVHGPVSLTSFHHSSRGWYMTPSLSSLCTGETLSPTDICEVPSLRISSSNSTQLPVLGSSVRALA